MVNWRLTQKRRRLHDIFKAVDKEGDGESVPETLCDISNAVWSSGS